MEVELMKACHVLLLITIGDTETSIQQVIDAVQDISDIYRHNVQNATKEFCTDYPENETIVCGESNSTDIHAMDSTKNADIAGVTITVYNESDASTMEALPAPVVGLSPRQAFYTEMECIPLERALGRISGETITYYPPGIPCLAVGEIITEDVLAYIRQKQRDGYVPNGARDRQLQTILVCKDKDIRM